MSLREDLMLQRYHEKNGTLVAFLSGRTGSTPAELWHDDHAGLWGMGPLNPPLLRVADLPRTKVLPEEIELIEQHTKEDEPTDPLMLRIKNL